MLRVAALLVAQMINIPAGSHRPLYSTAEGRVAVAAFRIDANHVTRREYLAFVRTHPEWRKQAVGAARANGSYLADWRGPLDAGDAVVMARPVTGVSWFAAQAYCGAQGKRLPSVIEWEYVAAASESRRDASRDVQRRKQLLEAYATRGGARVTSPEVNAYGVRNLHGSVWEWTLDFNASAPGHDAHNHVGVHSNHAYCASASIGSADPSDYPAFLRASVRAAQDARTTSSSLGFRCAAGV